VADSCPPQFAYANLVTISPGSFSVIEHGGDVEFPVQSGFHADLDVIEIDKHRDF
jgi:hypothetical protein